MSYQHVVVDFFLIFHSQICRALIGGVRLFFIGNEQSSCPTDSSRMIPQKRKGREETRYKKKKKHGKKAFKMKPPRPDNVQIFPCDFLHDGYNVQVSLVCACNTIPVGRDVSWIAPCVQCKSENSYWYVVATHNGESGSIRRSMSHIVPVHSFDLTKTESSVLRLTSLTSLFTAALFASSPHHTMF